MKASDRQLEKTRDYLTGLFSHAYSWLYYTINARVDREVEYKARGSQHFERGCSKSSNARLEEYWLVGHYDEMRYSASH